MFSPITYTLEDMPERHTPNALRPVICDDCELALHHPSGLRTKRAHTLALQRSRYRFAVIDYIGGQTQRCWCCGTQRYTGRHLVEVSPRVAEQLPSPPVARRGR